MAKQRFNDGIIEALSPPSRERVYTDFSTEIELDPASREIWIFGPGLVEWQLLGNDSMSLWTVDNVSVNGIFITAKQVYKIGAQTTVSEIRVYD